VTTLVVIAAVRFYREGLAELFERVDGFRVVASATTAEALPAIEGTTPDLALIATDGEDGPAFVRSITSRRPETQVVVIGIADDDPDVTSFAEAGVAGYVTDDASTSELVELVRGVARGEAPCPPRIAATLLQHVAAIAQDRRGQDRTSPLTAREQEIARLLERGLSNKQIAHDLNIEVATVKNHVHNILEKLQVARRGQAAAAIRREI
jgi:two-component system, NarL family, nitrate/nitrite response regulator NarL